MLTAVLDPTLLLGSAESPAHIGPDARADIFRLAIRRASHRLTPAPSISPPLNECEESEMQTLPL
jgi:hypothetical protein